MIIDKALLDSLFEQAKNSQRLRQNFDMRTSDNDNSQRMLNALLPGTEVPVHRHPNSSENVICLSGQMDWVIYEETKEAVTILDGFEQGMDAQDVSYRTVLREKERIHICPEDGNYGCIVPAGAWHTVQVYDPSVIYEAKDGKYGEDGSEIYNGELITHSDTASTMPFHNYLGDLKKNIEYIMGKECAEGNTEPISPDYISRLLNVPLEEVEKCMKEMGI